MTSSGTAWVQISETLFFLNVGPMTSQKHSARLTSSGVLRATPLMLYSQRQPKCTVNTDLRLTVVTWVCRAGYGPQAQTVADVATLDCTQNTIKDRFKASSSSRLRFYASSLSAVVQLLLISRPSAGAFAEAIGLDSGVRSNRLRDQSRASSAVLLIYMTVINNVTGEQYTRLYTRKLRLKPLR